MKNLTRSTRLAVVPAVFAALALSACQDEAPSAAPPTPASPTAEQSGAGGESQPTESSESQPAETATPAPETSQAPAPDNGGGSGTGCTDSSTFSFKKGSIAAKDQGATQTASYKGSGGQADVTFGKPTIDTSGGNTLFPGDGMKTVIYPVTIEMKSGSYFITSRLQVNLTDENDGSCRDDSGSYVLDRSEVLSVESLRTPGQKITKKMAFAIPANADLSKYHLLYSTDYSSGNAELAWKAQ